ncbi:MAG TPA: glycerophosphodiester phosphodiesterase family protein [Pseudolysinimonas sp.]|nr:glycerophosphodiester phosphodiesterase family protein [Pseudolysinimonas sp.]
MPRRRPTDPTGSAAGYFSPAPPRIIAHRGLAIDAPENTMLAFARALALGVTHLETDVHASADGVAMVSHDPDLVRMVGRNVRIEQLTSHELRRIPLGHGQGFVSLAEMLDGFPEARVNIDIKDPHAVDPTVVAVVSARATQRVLIGSFSGRRRQAAVQRLPGVATSLSAAAAVPAVLAARSGAIPALRRILTGVDAVQLPTRVARLDPFTPRALAAFHEVGVEVHAWTINDPDEMTRLLDLGVDGLITDRSDVALSLLRSRSGGRA